MSRSQPVDLKKSVDYAALKDRNVLLTGGASGFGRAFSHVFAENGANLVIADIQEGPGRDLESELSKTGAKVKFIRADVTSFESQVDLVRQALEFFPRHEIDVFIPCAGVLEEPTQINPQDPAGLADLKVAPKDMAGRIVKTNVIGVFTGIMLVARYGMGLHNASESGSGPTKSIVLIASLAGYCGAEGSIEYTAAKFGVRGMLRGFRKHLAALNVRINAVAPFYVDTPMTKDATPVLRQAGIPIATIEHVMEATMRLATDEDAWGRSIFVMPEGLSDGGDDSAGLQAGKAFSTQALGEHWALLINGPLSDEIPA